MSFLALFPLFIFGIELVRAAGYLQCLYVYQAVERPGPNHADPVVLKVPAGNENVFSNYSLLIEVILNSFFLFLFEPLSSC